MTETQREQIAAEIWPLLANHAPDMEMPETWEQAKAEMPEEDREIVDFVYTLADYGTESLGLRSSDVRTKYAEGEEV